MTVTPPVTDTPLASVIDGSRRGPYPYVGGTRRGVAEQLLQVIDERRPLIILTGTKGIGKSTLLDHIVSNLTSRGMHVARPDAASVRDVMSRVHERGPAASREPVVLIVDDAQTWPEEAVAGLVRAASGRTQVCLIGDDTLWPRVEAMTPPDNVRLTLSPLTPKEMPDFVATLLARSPQTLDRTISHQALDALYRESGGIPARIDEVLTAAVAIAYCRGRDHLALEIVDDAIASLAPPPVVPAFLPSGLRAVAASVARADVVTPAMVATAPALPIVDNAAPPQAEAVTIARSGRMGRLTRVVLGGVLAVAAVGVVMFGRDLSGDDGRPVPDAVSALSEPATSGPAAGEADRPLRAASAGAVGTRIAMPATPVDRVDIQPAAAEIGAGPIETRTDREADGHTSFADRPISNDGLMPPAAGTDGSFEVEPLVSRTDADPVASGRPEREAAAWPVAATAQADETASPGAGVPVSAGPPVSAGAMTVAGPLPAVAIPAADMTVSADAMTVSEPPPVGAAPAADQSASTGVTTMAEPLPVVTIPAVDASASAGAKTVSEPPPVSAASAADVPVSADATTAMGPLPADTPVSAPVTTMAEPPVESRQNAAALPAPVVEAGVLSPLATLPPMPNSAQADPSQPAPDPGRAAVPSSPGSDSAPPPPVAVAKLSPAALKGLLARARTSLRNGDVLSARLLFERAGAAGSGVGAVEAGKTYDPAFLTAVGAVGLHGDVERAATWYRRAVDLGYDRAAALLNALPAVRGQ